MSNQSLPLLDQPDAKPIVLLYVMFNRCSAMHDWCRHFLDANGRKLLQAVTAYASEYGKSAVLSLHDTSLRIFNLKTRQELAHGDCETSKENAEVVCAMRCAVPRGATSAGATRIEVARRVGEGTVPTMGGRAPSPRGAKQCREAQ